MEWKQVILGPTTSLEDSKKVLDYFLLNEKSFKDIPISWLVDHINLLDVEGLVSLFKVFRRSVELSTTLQKYFMLHYLLRSLLRLFKEPMTSNVSNNMFDYTLKEIKLLIIDIASSRPCLQSVLTKLLLKLLLDPSTINMFEDTDSPNNGYIELLDQVRKGKRAGISIASSRNDFRSPIRGTTLYTLNSQYTVSDRALKVIPTSSHMHIFDMISMLSNCINLNQKHLIGILTGTLLSLTDTTQPIPSMDYYNDLLPEKPIFERDIYVENIFLKNPFLFNILDIIAEYPPEFCRCFDIMKSLLASAIGSWNSEIVEPRRSFWINHTLQLVKLLQKVEWIPPKMKNCGDIFVHIKGKEVASILLSIWFFIKDNLPRSNSYTSINLDDQVIYQRKWPQDMKQDIYLSSFKFSLKQNAPSLASQSHLYKMVFRS